MAAIFVGGKVVSVTRIDKSTSGGKFISGYVGPYKFSALVFAEHAENPEWEIGRSRISKLLVSERQSSGWRAVYNWDRGLDMGIPPASENVQAVVDLVCGFAADRLWGKVGAE